MKVFIAPTCWPCSRAMHRVAGALKRHAPVWAEVVDRIDECDVQVLHAIGVDARPDMWAPGYAVIQYCTTADSVENREELWEPARVVWSYYPVEKQPENFYLAPLGVDPAFRSNGHTRDIGVVTSGTSSADGMEPIKEVAEAALLSGLSVVHLGPRKIEGMAVRREPSWVNYEDLSDTQVAEAYGRAHWVSGMRYFEGFELPAAEGLACGARPIAFAQPAMKLWYGDSVRYVPETRGDALIRALMEQFARPSPVGDGEQQLALARFDWKPIIEGFWERVRDGH